MNSLQASGIRFRGVGENIGYLLTPNMPDYKTERRLDGAKDFHQFRDQRRFGSHSSYDNYGDESFA